jgi:hypothetical protein
MSDKAQQQQQQDVPVAQTINRFMLKVKYSFYSTLVFFLFANPETYKVIQSIVHRPGVITNSAGLPTATGFFLSTGLFFVTMLGLMLLPS